MRRTVTTLAFLLAGAAAAVPVHADPYASNTSAGWMRSDVRRYYPEPTYSTRHHQEPIKGWFEMRGGFFDAQDLSDNDWTVGLKTTARVASQVLMGFSGDLHRRENAGRQVTSQYTDPSGHTVTTTVTSVQNESNLWPLMATLEFHASTGGSLDPYVGGGAGWEFLDVKAFDYNTGLSYDANYDGFGYQAFGGLRLPLGGRAKLSAEAYWNGSTVSRKIFDPNLGLEVEEQVNVDGFGGRGGLSFAF